MRDFEIPKELLDLVHSIAKEAYEEGHIDGLKESWECARKLTLLPFDDFKELFNKNYVVDAIRDYSVEEVLKKFNYDVETDVEVSSNKEDEIKVGDEVVDNCGDVLIITKTSQYDNGWHAICGNGSCGRILRSSIVRKTGRVYPEIAKLFKED